MCACGVSAFVPLFWALPQKYLTGTSAAVGFALINSVAGLGGFFGTTIFGWVTDLTGNYSRSLLFTAGTAVLAGQLHSATNPQTGVTGTVGLVTKTWGTYVSLDLADVRGPLECELIAVSKTGERRVVTGWVVGVPGDGVPGHPAHLLVQGGTAISAANLARFDVIVVNGKTLLSIPV